jgi:hypothetical protein
MKTLENRKTNKNVALKKWKEFTIYQAPNVLRRVLIDEILLFSW